MKKFFRTMLMSTVVLGLFSCADKVADEVALGGEGTPGSSNGVTDGWVSFKINTIGQGNMARATRAEGDGSNENNGNLGSFDKGIEDEYAITGKTGANVVFTFQEGKYQGRSELTVLGDATTSKDGHTDEVYFSARIRKAKDIPTLQCIMILNADPAELREMELVEGETTLEQFLEKTSEKSGQYTDDKGITYFTMSNTVYRESDTATATDDDHAAGNVVDVFPIGNGNIYTTTYEASENPVVVHVERVAAKFGLTFDKKNENASILGANDVLKMGANNLLYVLDKFDFTEEQVEQRQWAVKITGWGVNGTETATYWVKNLTDDIKGKFNTAWGGEYGTSNGWNDHSRKRSYWAVDPHYTTGRYPQQYREAKNATDVEYGEDKDNALNYIDYGTLIGNTITKSLYAPENTFGGTLDHKLAGTHLLIAAELMIADKNGEFAENPQDIYCYENIYWTDAKELLKYMVNNILTDYKTALYVKNENGEYDPLDPNKADQYFELGAPATIKGGDGRVMLTLKGGENKLYYNAEIEGGQFNYVEVGPNDENLFDVIYKAGTAKHYNKGKMYYAAPIKHMASSGIGSYGVVRNHWYKVNVSDIQKPGTPVNDPDQPIIPNDDPDEGGYIAFEINIIPWHVIEEDVNF